MKPSQGQSMIILDYPWLILWNILLYFTQYSNVLVTQYKFTLSQGIVCTAPQEFVFQ